MHPLCFFEPFTAGELVNTSVMLLHNVSYYYFFCDRSMMTFYSHVGVPLTSPFSYCPLKFRYSNPFLDRAAYYCLLRRQWGLYQRCCICKWDGLRLWRHICERMGWRRRSTESGREKTLSGLGTRQHEHVDQRHPWSESAEFGDKSYVFGRCLWRHRGFEQGRAARCQAR